MNLIPFIKPKRNKTHYVDSNEKERVVYTTDFVKIASKEEVENGLFHQDYKIQTDYADEFSSDGFVKRVDGEEEGVRLKLRSSSACGCVDHDYFSNIPRFVNMQVRFGISGMLPILSLDLDAIKKSKIDFNEIFKIEEKVDKRGNLKHYLKLGEYPNSSINFQVRDKLNQLYNKGKVLEPLKPTNRYYTLPGNRYGNEMLVPEFELNGEKYVRLSELKARYYSKNDEENVWYKVEPLTFEIKNWDNLPKSINPNSNAENVDSEIVLESEKSLISHIEFNPVASQDDACSWQVSKIRSFLNSISNVEYDQDPGNHIFAGCDYTGRGFLEEAFNLDREPIKEYRIDPESISISSFFFDGCVGLERVIVPANVDTIYEEGLFGLNENVQIVIETKGRKDGLDFQDSYFYHLMYISKEDESIILTNDPNSELEKKCIREAHDCDRLAELLNKHQYRHNYVMANIWKDEGKIKFFPQKFMLEIFPADQFDKFIINKNHMRWGRLIKELKFDTLPVYIQENSITDLFKIYYAIGGFSENQGESEKAYEYIKNYVAVNEDHVKCGEFIHEKFSQLKLEGEYNRMFAKFFMKYYKDNPDFMEFDLGDPEQGLVDYICQAHNNWNNIIRCYPNMVINGNERRSLLTPEFVAKHLFTIKYENIREGNNDLADLIGKYGYTQSQFDEIQDIFDKAKQIKDQYVIKANKADENDLIEFRLLEKDDPLGFVLGNITNCCQHIDGVGGNCVVDGYINPHAGFIVFEESIKDESGNLTGEKRILGQVYVWYDPKTKTICYDNIEVPKKVLNELVSADKHGKGVSTRTFVDAIVKSANAVMLAMNKTDIKVERVTTGEGYNDLVGELSNRFERELNPIAKHRNYNGYSDANYAQYVISCYDKITNAFADVVKSSVKSAGNDLSVLSNSEENNINL